ncbi:MAG: hypothetical protein LKJ17_12460 [Oscillospiraceae bacterium]|nr:hypothetical protein [Oscillospiraceae bacterium]
MSVKIIFSKERKIRCEKGVSRSTELLFFMPNDQYILKSDKNPRRNWLEKYSEEVFLQGTLAIYVIASYNILLPRKEVRICGVDVAAAASVGAADGYGTAVAGAAVVGLFAAGKAEFPCARNTGRRGSFMLNAESLQKILFRCTAKYP